MTARTWHVEGSAMLRYVAGHCEGTERGSIETHLVSCGECRELLGAERGAPNATTWDGVLDRIDQTHRPLSRWTGWVALSVASPSLTAATLALSGGLLGLVAAMVAFGWWGALPALVALAPLAPPAGAVLAFRPGMDPAGALAAATPMAGSRLPMLRAAFAASVALTAGLAAAAVTPLGWESVAVWLLPGIAMSATVAAAATWFDPLRLYIAGAAGWALVVARWAQGHRNPWTQATLDQIIVARPVAQALSLTVFCGAGLVWILRRNAIPSWRTT